MTTDRIALAIGTMLVLSFAIYGQAPSPTPSEDVVRISTQLVQLDAVVIDKGGRPVRDLKASDFEVLQDGKPQKIVNFSYVDTQPPAPAKIDKQAPQAPPVPVRSNHTGRVITFIVDDGNCAVSIGGMRAAREALVKFVREQMLPDDRVAIYRTRSGSSMLQQYISDKAQLLRTIEKIQWYPATGVCSNNSGSIFEAAKSNSFPEISAASSRVVKSKVGDDQAAKAAVDEFATNNQVIGTLGVLNYVVRGLEHVNGRKVIFFLSDGMPFQSHTGELLSAADVLQGLAEAANRASAVFNTIDVRGLVNTEAIEAVDEVYSQSDPYASDKVSSSRQNSLLQTRNGMQYLAYATGGRFYHDNNFLDVPIRKALAVETGYYLLAYEPDDETFKGKAFHKIAIKVRQPDLSVRSRSGFFGLPDQHIVPKRRAQDSDLYQAIAAPLPVSGLDLRLTALFVNTAESGNVVRSLVLLPGDAITFTDEGGMKKASIDVVAVTLDEKNQVVDQFNRTHVFKVSPATMPYIQKNGVIYSTDVPIKKAGVYNFRIAIRDSASNAVGSATQIVDIPNYQKARMFISELTMTEVDQNGKFSLPVATKAEEAISVPRSASVPAIRRFRRGSVIAYAYTVYNAQPGATGAPNVSITVNLFKDGQPVTKGSEQAAQFEKQADWSRIKDYGYMRLKPEMQPGEYVLQLIVKDLNKNVVSTQWVDFDVTQ